MYSQYEKDEMLSVSSPSYLFIKGVEKLKYYIKNAITFSSGPWDALIIDKDDEGGLTVYNGCDLIICFKDKPTFDGNCREATAWLFDGAPDPLHKWN